MRNLNIIVAIAVLMLCPKANSQAQMWKKVMKGMDKSIQMGIERGLTKATERVVENATCLPHDKLLPNEVLAQSLEERMLKAIGADNVPHLQAYTYSATMHIEIERTDAPNTNTRMAYRVHLSKNDGGYAFNFIDPTRKNTNRLVIYDSQNQAMLVLSETENTKQGIATRLSQSDSLLASIGHRPAANYQPTGRSKKIAGHKCKEFIYENDTVHSLIWVTPRVKTNLAHAYTYVGGLQVLSLAAPTAPTSMVMEQHLTHKQSGSTIHLTAKKIEQKENIINLSDYKIYGVGQVPTE